MPAIIWRSLFCLPISRSTTKSFMKTRVYRLHYENYGFLRSLSTAAKRSYGDWESVVGLEVHAQISSNSKLFSGSGTSFAAYVNEQVAFFDAALPGTLPVLNKRCVEAAVLTALSLNCQINKKSVFDRKHYFYADLPSGFQITQQRRPLAVNGRLPFVVLNTKEPYVHEARLLQLQLEQDSGKSLHDPDANVSFIDLNRAGLALMELVFDANLSNGEEAAAMVEELQLLLQCLGTCDGKMEEGSLRVDANVSINLPGEPWGMRTEIKNINSTRAVAKAVDYEIRRQIHVLETGGKIENETRMYDSKLKVTIPMRDKETQQDYRFMPEPNLPPLCLHDKEENIPGTVSIAKVASTLPSRLPFDLRLDLSKQYDLPLKTADVLLKHEKLLDYFLEIVNEGKRNPHHVLKFLLNEVYTVLNRHNMTLAQSTISAPKLAEIYDLHSKKKILSANKIELLEMIINGDDRSLSVIVADKKWQVINSEEEIVKIVKQVLDQNPKLVTLYKSGKPKVENALLGAIRKSANSQLDMALAAQILKKLLSK